MALYLIILFNVANTIALKANKVIVPLFGIHLGASPAGIGLLMSLQAFFPLLLAVFAGKISDRFGARLPIFFGSVGMAAGFLLPFLTPSLLTLYFSQTLIGLSNIFFHISTHHLVGSIGGAEARTRNFSLYSIWVSVASFIGPLFVGFSIDQSGYVLSFLALSLISLIPIAILLLPHKFTNVNHHKNKSDDQKSSVMDLLKMPPLRRTFITSGIVLAGIELYSFYFPIYGNSIGFSATMIGAVLGVHASASLIVRLIMPLLVKKYHEENVLAYSLLLAGATYFMFPFFENILVLSLISFILGLGLGCGQPLSIILTYNRSPKGRAGEALGARVTVNKLTQVVFPILFGSLGSAFGLFPVFFSNALLLLFGGYITREKEEDADNNKPDGQN